MSVLETGDGNTPLAAEELAELIPNLATKQELNEWERLNILEAWRWATGEAFWRRAVCADGRICEGVARADVRRDVAMGGQVS